jgi:hypothetical protein
VPGVRIFKPHDGVELATFAGPRGALTSDGQWLYSSAPDGLAIWDPDTGERTGTVLGFVPTRHHRGSRELVAVEGRHLVRWRCPRGQPGQAVP